MSDHSPRIMCRKPVTYRGGSPEVQLGDRVKARLWLLFPKNGRVVYVPGISQRHPEFERDGLEWVVVKCDDGTVFGEVVDPKTGSLLKNLVFISRDLSSADEIKPGDKFPD